MQHFLSLKNIGTENLVKIVDNSVEASKGNYNPQAFQHKCMGIYFACSSTRTRTSFTVGAYRLGVKVIAYGEKDLQIATGETLEDTARVLSQYLDALVIRTNGKIEDMEAMTVQNRMAIINAMNEIEHPTQAVADLSTIQVLFGRLHDVHLLYIGEGNNTAIALAYAFSHLPQTKLTLITPEGYGIPENLLREAQRMAKENGAEIEQHHDINNLPESVDLVYATRWQTMGVVKDEENWQEKFVSYKITNEILRQVSRTDKTYFMHDLPAVRGVDVDDEVLDGPQSRAFLQAQHKLFAAMAVLDWCLSEND